MKKNSIAFLFFLIIPLLISCSEEESEDETFTLELIGESTVYIEEGMPYVDQGVLLNGEPTFDVSYMSNVDTKRVGTYYVEFMHYDQTLLRTVIVTEGANTIYKRMIEALKTADSYSYTQQLEVSYKNNGTEVNYYYNKAYDVYGDYTYGNSQYENVNGSVDISEYTFMNRETNKIERYAFDDFGFGYFENNLYQNNNTAKTDFVLDYYSYATRELVNDEYVYSVYLKPGGYDSGFYEYINYIDHVGLNSNGLEPLKITVYTKDDHISKIIIDLSEILQSHLNEPNPISDLSYIFIYEFSNINALSPITIPEEGLAAKPE
jgi:hypothetical protein